jgi:hypothetical protein
MVSAAGKNIPVLESPVGVIDGAEVLPAATVVTPVFVMLVAVTVVAVTDVKVETPEELKVLLPILIVPD